MKASRMFGWDYPPGVTGEEPEEDPVQAWHRKLPLIRYGREFVDYDDYLDWKHKILTGWHDDEDEEE